MIYFLIPLFGWLGICISLYLYFLPYFSYKDLIKRIKNINEVPNIILLLYILKSSAQLGKSLKMNQIEFLICNGTGIVILLIWFSIWLVYFAEKNIVSILLYYFLLYDAVLEIIFIFYIIIESTLIKQIIITIINFILSFSFIPYKKLIVASKNGDYNIIPITYIIINVVNNICWFIYGLYKNDFSIYIDNTINLLICFFQFMFYIYLKNNLIKYNINHKELKEEKNNTRVV